VPTIYVQESTPHTATTVAGSESSTLLPAAQAKKASSRPESRPYKIETGQYDPDTHWRKDSSEIEALLLLGVKSQYHGSVLSFF
jgi:hypothetical protein